MHEIRFRLGLRPRLCWGSLERSPDTLAGWISGALFLKEGREWEGGKEEERREGKEKGGKRRKGKVWPPKGWLTAPCSKSWKIPWLQVTVLVKLSAFRATSSRRPSTRAFTTPTARVKQCSGRRYRRRWKTDRSMIREESAARLQQQAVCI